MVDRVGRHAGSWWYIQGSFHNHGNEMKRHNFQLMQCSVYAVHSLGCTRCICTQCQLMIMTWWDREGWLNSVFSNNGRVVDEKEGEGGWRWVRCGEYETIWDIRGMNRLIGMGRPCIGVITCHMGTRTCFMGDGKFTHPRNSLKSPFLMLISPISCHLSQSRRQVYPHKVK